LPQQLKQQKTPQLLFRVTVVLLWLTYVNTVLLMLLLLEPKKRSFVPRAVRSALQSNEDFRLVWRGCMSTKRELEALGVPLG
jgi:hypothetical protein